jgi:tetratricopeptide (TPR) repeat protein
MSASGAQPRPVLQRLLGFLEHDPNNLRLIADAAAAALDAGDTAAVAALIDRYAAIAPLPPAMLNLRGLAAIEDRRFDAAAEVFEALLAAEPDDPVLRFNLGLARAMLKDYAGASALLDVAAIEVSAAAPALKIQVLHHLGELEEALAWGQGLAERHPGDHELMGALAAVAIDAGDLTLADYFAIRAGDQHDGLATRGMLRLNEDQVDASLELFDRALESYPDDARALLGKGLGRMAQGEAAVAAPLIDRAAELFERHLGTWVAAGWAYFSEGDLATARARFETAMSIDDTFAEIHGGLAVIDFMEGDIEGAKRRTDVALRLDRNCFSAALAKVMLLSNRGDLRAAERVRNMAMNTPIGPGGRTLAQALASMTIASRPAKR